MSRDAPVSASSPPRSLLDRAGDGHRSFFGTTPQWTAIAPGRVNLIGEHVDYCGGLVLPMAIDRWAAAAAAPARDETRLYAIDLGRSGRLGEDHPELRALAAVVRRFGADDRSLPPLDIAVTSDVPRGAGLSSSAAVEIAVATVLEAVIGTRLSLREKALLCQHAEHDAGVPCGIMDMYVSAGAEAGCAMLIDCDSLDTRSIALPPPDLCTVLIVDTKVDRSLAGTAYRERRTTCDHIAEVLGVASLRHADRTMLDSAALSATERDRATHVLDENDRTRRAVGLLERGDTEALGDLLFDGHESLRRLYEVSCPELDTIVDTARALRDEDAGVFGARMTGAGFGGSAIVLCRSAAASAVAGRLRGAFGTAHGRIVEPSVVRAVGGSRVL